MLSNKQVEIYKQINGSEGPKDEKTNMIFNVNDQNKYVVHIRTLQIYLKHGLKLRRCIEQ